MRQRPQNILIYRLGSLGDTIMALPCFHKIRKVYPDADITLLTNWPVATKAAPIEAVLGNGYFFNRVLAYPLGTRSVFVLLSLIREIRSLKIQTVINITAPRSSASVKRDKWFFRAAGVKYLIGFQNQPEDHYLIQDPLTGEYEWEAKRLARRVESLGVIPLENNQYWNLRLTENELSHAHTLLASFSPDAPILAISVGTKIQAKDWGEPNWLQLMSQLRDSLKGWQLLLIGASEEFASAERCLQAWGTNGLNLCGKASPRVSAAVLQKAKVFVGHDSGPMHLAACVGTPCVAIFSARNLPRQWYPRGELNYILYKKTDCAGCGLEVCIDQQKKCILSISVDEVIQAILQVTQIRESHAKIDDY